VSSVVIYPGFGKTGTTALQVVLRCNRGALQGIGFDYRADPDEGDPGPVTSGNGGDLAVSLLWKADDEAVGTALDALLASDGLTSIIASEWMGVFRDDQWERLFEMLASRVSSRKVVVVVRDIYPLAVASYSQGVKREGYHEPFGRFARTHVANGLRPGQSLRALRGLLEPSELAVLHYDSIRSDLVPELLAAGGVRPDALHLGVGGSAERPRNRSLSPGETVVLKQVNAQFGNAYSKMLSDMLGEREPLLIATPPIDEDALEFLTEHFEQWVDEINRFHFDGQPVGKVIDRSSESARGVDPAAQDADARDATEFLLKRLSGPANRLRFRKLRASLEQGLG